MLDVELLAMRLLWLLREQYASLLAARYRIQPEESDGLDAYELLCLVGRKRGMLISGGEVNTERAAITILDEFRSGKLGKITLDCAPEEDTDVCV